MFQNLYYLEYPLNPKIVWGVIALGKRASSSDIVCIQDRKKQERELQGTSSDVLYLQDRAGQAMSTQGHLPECPSKNTRRKFQGRFFLGGFQVIITCSITCPKFLGI